MLTRQVGFEGLRPLQRGGQLALHLGLSLLEDLLPILNCHGPVRHHGVGHGWRQRRAQSIDFRLFILPELQFVIDRGAAALPDFGIDEVNGQLVLPTAGGDQAGRGFTGADSGIAHTAHRGLLVVNVQNSRGLN